MMVLVVKVLFGVVEVVLRGFRKIEYFCGLESELIENFPVHFPTFRAS